MPIAPTIGPAPPNMSAISAPVLMSWRPASPASFPVRATASKP
jgi:hypothetical protein